MHVCTGCALGGKGAQARSANEAGARPPAVTGQGMEDRGPFSRTW